MKDKLIILKGEDKTSEIKSIKKEGALYKVVFYNQPKVYSYKVRDVKLIHAEKCINITDQIVYIENAIVRNIKSIILFKGISRVIFKNQSNYKSDLYSTNDIDVSKDQLKNAKSRELFNYFKRVANIVGAKENGNNLLAMQYSKIERISNNIVLGKYLSKKKNIKSYQLPNEIIYPFGLNISQKKAVENTFLSQVSVIEGPPGTGKTQTILNIIANMLILDKTVAVVSYNNSATQNVYDKFKKYGLEFILAPLGNTERTKHFIDCQSDYPEYIHDWKLSDEHIIKMKSQINEITNELNEKLKYKNEISCINQQLWQMETEQTHFNKENEVEINQEYLLSVKKCDAKKILKLILEYEYYMENSHFSSILSMIKILFKYHHRCFKIIRRKDSQYILFLQKQYYIKKQEELEKQKKDIEAILGKYDFDGKLNEVTELSMQVFKAYIANKYLNQNSKDNCQRIKFCHYQAIKDSPKQFTKEYPVILSTTYSISKIFDQEFVYDYVIVDEASQVDLVTGVLAMSCAKNIVVVGDLKQLTNVDNHDVSYCNKELNDNDDGYNYSNHNLLSSVNKIFVNAPRVLLREHYRCHPKIINFCNQEFYNGELIILTEENDKLGNRFDDDPFTIISTVPGKHERNKKNQRQIDTINNEIIKQLGKTNSDDIGIISPYRNQIDALNQQSITSCDIDTIHRFQGRENEVIIISTVKDNLDDPFLNDPRLINVAVSRAVKKLIVVISGNKYSDLSYYGKLINYITYHKCEVIQGKTKSVFDLLYQQYNEERKEFLKNHKRISEYDSENLLYGIICDEILCKSEFSQFDCRCHVSLVNIIHSYEFFSPKEVKYAKNPLTHVDFLIFDKYKKSPVLAIEVDGTTYHKKGSIQESRDRLKDNIFKIIDVPLLRLSTDGSNEIEKISEQLKKHILKNK